MPTPGRRRRRLPTASGAADAAGRSATPSPWPAARGTALPHPRVSARAPALSEPSILFGTDRQMPVGMQQPVTQP